MNLRTLGIFAVLCLSACNGSSSQAPQPETEDSTFSDLASARTQLGEVNAQIKAGKQTLADAAARQAQLAAEIAAARKKVDELDAQRETTDSEIAKAKVELEGLIESARIKAYEIRQATTALNDLTRTDADNPGEIAKATTKLTNLTEEAGHKTQELEQAQKRLDALNAAADKPGSIAEAQKKLDERIDEARLKRDELEQAQTKLDDLTRTDAGSPGKIAVAQKELERLQGDGKGTPGEIAKAQTKLNALVEEARLKTIDVSEAKADLETLRGNGADKKGTIKEAQEELDALKEEVRLKTIDLNTAKAELEKLQGDGADKKGTIKEAQEELISLQAQVTTKTAELNLAQKALDDLTREDNDNPGKIAAARKTLDGLKVEAEAKEAELRRAREEFERLKGLGKNIIDAAKLEAMTIKANAFKEAGKFKEAADLFKQAGMSKDAADMFKLAGLSKDAAEMFKLAGLGQDAAEMFMKAGMENDAFDLVAPKDSVFTDKIAYTPGADAALELTAVSETPSVKRQTIKLGGKSVPFTAKAGHLIAYAPKDPKNPDKKDAQASIFYMAYTREGLSHEQRPVTFFFNGGPGEPSIWLHMGSFAPKRLKTGEPEIPASALKKRPSSFPLIESEESLLDKTDLVFVDPPGAGYSQAIKPHKNREFWGPEVDAKIVRDFIVRYVNVNNRQLSPKYIYGESYSGIRVPILSRLIEEGGKSQFDPDPSGKDPVVLSGIILNAPILSYVSSCRYGGVSCAGFVPAFAMLADVFKLSTVNGLATIPGSVDTLRTFVSGTYSPALEKFLNKSKPAEWTDYAASMAGKQFLQDMKDKTGVASDAWKNTLNMSGRTYMGKVKPSASFNAYDARMLIPYINGVIQYDPSYYEDDAFDKGIADLLPGFLNYRATTTYMSSNVAGGTSPANANWNWSPGKNSTTGLPALSATLGYDPSLKVLVLHGYYDLVTPFYQTELDLKSVGLADRVPVKNFKGGHMTYVSEEARVPMKTALDEYYDAPPYSPPLPVALN